GIASQNIETMNTVLEDLLALSRVDHKPRQKRNVRLSEAVTEVRRRLRDFAGSRNVAIEVPQPLPDIEVDAAAVELCLATYISNAVKYSDPGKPARWIRIAAQ